MALKKSPCFGCEERTSECHAKCPKYAEFAKNRKRNAVTAVESEEDQTGTG